MEYADWEEEQCRKAEEAARQKYWQTSRERIRRNNYSLEYDRQGL